MAKPESIELRGFDSYPVSLGDELRGERASLGKSLLDVQRELRIKAAHIAAIENADPDAIPYKGFVTGYVRAYARYLGLDDEAVLRRFCAESGFVPPGGAGGGPAKARAAAPPRADLDALIAGSRMAAVSRATSHNSDFGSTLRGLGSLAVLAALLAGLAWGGWRVLETIQRVTFAPLPDAPEVLADVPDLGAMTRLAAAAVGAAPVIDAEALAAVYAAQELPPPPAPLRDGPISAIDPESAGVYAGAIRAGAPPQDATVDADAADPALSAAGPEDEPEGEPGGGTAVAAGGPELPQEQPAVSGPPAAPSLGLVFAAEAWVRVRDDSGAVVHEALMRGGQSWEAPAGRSGLTLRAGNAGGVYVDLGGTLYGPLGRPGGVVSNLSLDPERLREALPAVDPREAATLTATVSAGLGVAPPR